MKKFISFIIISAVPIIIGIIIGLNISYFDPFFKLNFKNQNEYPAYIELTTEDNIKHIFTMDKKSNQSITIYNKGETHFSFKININNNIINYSNGYIEGNQDKTINIFNQKVEVKND